MRSQSIWVVCLFSCIPVLALAQPPEQKYFSIDSARTLQQQKLPASAAPPAKFFPLHKEKAMMPLTFAPRGSRAAGSKVSASAAPQRPRDAARLPAPSPVPDGAKSAMTEESARHLLSIFPSSD